MYILLALFLQSFLEPSCQVDKIMEDDQFFSPLSLSPFPVYFILQLILGDGMPPSLVLFLVLTPLGIMIFDICCCHCDECMGDEADGSSSSSSAALATANSRE